MSWHWQGIISALILPFILSTCHSPHPCQKHVFSMNRSQFILSFDMLVPPLTSLQFSYLHIVLNAPSFLPSMREDTVLYHHFQVFRMLWSAFPNLPALWQCLIWLPSAVCSLSLVLFYKALSVGSRGSSQLLLSPYPRRMKVALLYSLHSFLLRWSQTAVELTRCIAEEPSPLTWVPISQP